MPVKPTVALRAILVGGIAAFAKIGGAMKAAGGVKIGVQNQIKRILLCNLPNDFWNNIPNFCNCEQQTDT